MKSQFSGQSRQRRHYRDRPGASGVAVRLDRRKGAVILEGTIVLGVFLSILLAFLDVSLAVIEQHSLTEAARQVAQAAARHGSRASAGTSWGPTTYSGTVADDSDIASTALPTLIGVEPAHASVEVQWLDNYNRPGDRVRVTVEYEHQSLFPFTYGTSLELRAVSVMRIAH